LRAYAIKIGVRRRPKKKGNPKTPREDLAWVSKAQVVCKEEEEKRHENHHGSLRV